MAFNPPHKLRDNIEAHRNALTFRTGYQLGTDDVREKACWQTQEKPALTEAIDGSQLLKSETYRKAKGISL